MIRKSCSSSPLSHITHAIHIFIHEHTLKVLVHVMMKLPPLNATHIQMLTLTHTHTFTQCAVLNPVNDCQIKIHWKPLYKFPRILAHASEHPPRISSLCTCAMSVYTFSTLTPRASNIYPSVFQKIVILLIFFL